MWSTIFFATWSRFLIRKQFVCFNPMHFEVVACRLDAGGRRMRVREPGRNFVFKHSEGCVRWLWIFGALSRRVLDFAGTTPGCKVKGICVRSALKASSTQNMGHCTINLAVDNPPKSNCELLCCCGDIFKTGNHSSLTLML